MYAMDTAVHFEHRTETRRSRAEIRRATRAAAAPAPSSATGPVPADGPDTRSADDFAD
ncbi:MAG: hypothetical protein U0Q03_02405 [Acidimicrobiales bacterium]